MAKPALLAAAFAAAALALASTSAAQNPTRSSQPSESVVVLGQRATEEAIHTFVRQMAVAPRGQNQIARWGQTLCPGVAGLQAHYAQFILDRMAQRAEAVKVEIGAPGCRANTLIVVTNDADAVVRDLFEHNKTMMGYYTIRGHSTAGRRALAAFVNSDAPVRWWHVSHTMSETGEEIMPPSGSGGEGHTSSVDSTLALSAAFPVVSVAGSASRLSRATRQDFGKVFIIVDARQLRGVSFEALADYLSMVTLAQLNPAADTSSYPTILNLFTTEGPARPAAMTEWDVAYLQGLYDATANARSANQQEGEIATSMARDMNVH